MTKTVTAIVPRGKRRAQVYLDGQYGFTLSMKLAREIQESEQLSEDRIRELAERDKLENAYQQGLRLISYRPRTERELRLRYDRKGVADSIQEKALDRLKTEGLVNDAEFARAWIENRMEFRPRGAWALRSELNSKGVARDTIDLALADFDESEAARRAADEGARRYEELSPDLFRRRLSAYLSRRGFNYQTVAPLVSERVAELEAESEGSN